VISSSSKLDFAGLPSNNWASIIGLRSFAIMKHAHLAVMPFHPFSNSFTIFLPFSQNRSPLFLFLFVVRAPFSPLLMAARNGRRLHATPIACSSLRPCVERRWGQSPCRSPKQAPPVATADSPCRAPRRLRGGSRGQSPRRGPEQALPAAAADRAPAVAPRRPRQAAVRGPQRGGRPPRRRPRSQACCAR